MTVIEASSIIAMSLTVDADLDALDYINLVRPIVAQSLRVDFTWSPPGSLYTYPNGHSSGAYMAALGTPLTFTASAVNAIGSAVQPVLYEWDFGDGTTAFGAVVTHTYTTHNENVRVSLCVTGSNGVRICVGHQLILSDPLMTSPSLLTSTTLLTR